MKRIHVALTARGWRAIVTEAGKLDRVGREARIYGPSTLVTNKPSNGGPQCWLETTARVRVTP